MFDRILVPLDGSPLAEAILSQVRRILLVKDAEILLVSAVSPTATAEADAIESVGFLQATALQYLEGIAEPLREQGARVRSVVQTGSPADTILRVAGEEKTSLIAMSTHGRTGIRRWVFGSVAEKILRASRVPVLAVRSFLGTGPDASRTPPSELALKRILVPVDSENLSLEVISPVVELAGLFGSQVILVHICEGVKCTVPVDQMAAAHEKLRKAGISAEPVMEQGDPALGILQACEARQADLIAMTTHGRAGFARWMLGSVTEKVLRSSVVPLLVVRPSGNSTEPNTRRKTERQAMLG